MSPSIERLIERGRRNLAAAVALHEGGFFEIAVSRAYYAMFYLAEAALLSRDLAFSRHSAVIAGFHQELVRTGILSREAYEAFQRAFEERNRADYGDEGSISAEEARKHLNAAESFVIRVEAWLRKQAG